MSYPAKIEVFNTTSRQESIAFAFSTKDRTDLSARSLEPLRSAGAFDLYWMDGSSTESGRAFPAQVGRDIPNLREVHYGVTGGPDVAIVYSLTYLLAKGYSHVGLIENDVLVEAGWLPRLLRLFEQGTHDGLRVGAVSARTIRERTLAPHGDYAVMFNLGAGMVLFTREAAQAVLNRYRTTTGEEIRGVVRSRAGIDIHGIGYAQTSTSADWYFDVGLLLDGYCSLAPIPSLANNIDADLSKWGCTLVHNPDQVPARPGVFDLFRSMHRKPFEAAPEQVAVHPGLGRMVFPHQLITAIPDLASDGWNLVWKQTLGPFALNAKSEGATLTLPVFGSPTAFIMEAGPQGGEIAVRMGNEENRFSLLREKPEVVSILCSEQNPTGLPVQLRVVAPGAMLLGLQLHDPWLTFPSARSFNFEVLRPFIS